MNGSFRHGDDELLDTLRSAVNGPGEVPPEVVAAAKGAFAWRTIDAELAALVEESWAGQDSLVGVRSVEPGDRTLVFRAADTVLEVDVSDDGLVGQIDPARSGTVVLECADGTSTMAEIDELGWFTLDRRSSGMVRLRCSPDGAASFVTEWVRLR